MRVLLSVAGGPRLVSRGVGTAIVAASAALLGVVLTELFVWWRERAAHRRALQMRWDEARLNVFGKYLTTANKAHRALMYALDAIGKGNPETDRLRTEALQVFEEVHADSEAVTLLTGVRSDAVRAAARDVRQQLEPLHRSVELREYCEAWEAHSAEYRAAREKFIDGAQARLNIPL